MQIQTTRFGQIELDHSDILLMPHGLIGFESSRHWVLLSNSTMEDVAWLQSISQPSVAVPVISPRRFAPEYRVQLPQRELSLLHLREQDQLYVLTIVSKAGHALTTNLKSPILINASRQVAAQVVCSDERPIAFPIGMTKSDSAKQPAAPNRQPSLRNRAA